MSHLRIVIETQLDGTQVGAAMDVAGGDGNRDLQNFAKWLAGKDGGRGLHLRTVKNAVRATLNGTFTGDPTAGQALTINGVTFTARASGAVANEFNIATGANAAPLVAAINASVTAKIAGIVKAEVVSAQVLKLTCLIPGTIGNLCTVSENMDNFTLAGGATAMSGGTEDTEVLIDAGLAAS
jgi:hypothetical protein